MCANESMKLLTPVCRFVFLGLQVPTQSSSTILGFHATCFAIEISLISVVYPPISEFGLLFTENHGWHSGRESSSSGTLRSWCSQRFWERIPYGNWSCHAPNCCGVTICRWVIQYITTMGTVSGWTYRLMFMKCPFLPTISGTLLISIKFKLWHSTFNSTGHLFSSWSS